MGEENVPRKREGIRLKDILRDLNDANSRSISDPLYRNNPQIVEAHLIAMGFKKQSYFGNNKPQSITRKVRGSITGGLRFLKDGRFDFEYGPGGIVMATYKLEVGSDSNPLELGEIEIKKSDNSSVKLDDFRYIGSRQVKKDYAVVQNYVDMFNALSRPIEEFDIKNPQFSNDMRLKSHLRRVLRVDRGS